MIQQMLAKDLRPVTGRNEQRARRGFPAGALVDISGQRTQRLFFFVSRRDRRLTRIH